MLCKTDSKKRPVSGRFLDCLIVSYNGTASKLEPKTIIKRNMKERIKWIDTAKGIGIILVILGHVTSAKSNLVIVIYSFHMPLFFFLSGYVFSYKKYQNGWLFLKKKAQNLLIPFFCFTGVAIFLGILQSAPWTLAEMGRFLIYIENNTRTITAIWFFPCLFLAEVIFYYFLLFTKEKFWISILVVIGLLGTNYFLGKYVNHDYLPWKIRPALVAVVFLWAGYLIRKLIDDDKFSLNAGLFLISIALNLAFIYFNNGIQIMMTYSFYGNFLYFFITAIFGILAVMYLARFIQNLSLVNYIGKSTLIILPIHGLLINFFGTYNNLPLPYNLYITLATLVITAPIIEIINRFFPQIIGQSIYTVEKK